MLIWLNLIQDQNGRGQVHILMALLLQTYIYILFSHITSSEYFLDVFIKWLEEERYGSDKKAKVSIIPRSTPDPGKMIS